MKTLNKIQTDCEGETGTVWNVPFQHIYLMDRFFSGAKLRHSCLWSGYWCFKDFIEHPKDIVVYIKKKK